MDATKWRRRQFKLFVREMLEITEGMPFGMMAPEDLPPDGQALWNGIMKWLCPAFNPPASHKNIRQEEKNV